MTALLVAGFLFHAATRASAQTNSAAPPASPWSLDAGGTLLVEAWDYNLSKENLAGGSVAVRGALTPRWSLGGEAVMFAAKQRGSQRDAVVIGGGPVIRAQFPQTARTALLAELMLGVSHADRRVPPRGTRFNYLARGSVGAAYRLTRSVSGTLLFSYLHLSNNSHDGRDRNPDIQALGGTLGISVAF